MKELQLMLPVMGNVYFISIIIFTWIFCPSKRQIYIMVVELLSATNFSGYFIWDSAKENVFFPHDGEEILIKILLWREKISLSPKFRSKKNLPNSFAKVAKVFPLVIISCTRTKNNKSVFKFSVTNEGANFDTFNEDVVKSSKVSTNKQPIKNLVFYFRFSEIFFWNTLE